MPALGSVLSSFNISAPHLAAVNPSVTDDVNAGYRTGDDWINTSAKSSWRCVDASAGAAVWHQTDTTGAGTPATTVVSETTAGQAAAVGTSTNYAREDHTHGTPAGGGGINGGTATLNFGAFAPPAPASPYGHPNTEAKVTVTGQSGILATSKVQAWIRVEPAGSADHSMEEHQIESLKITAGNITPGGGFDIMGECLLGGTYGAFAVSWSWI